MRIFIAAAVVDGYVIGGLNVADYYSWGGGPANLALGIIDIVLACIVGAALTLFWDEL